MNRAASCHVATGAGEGSPSSPGFRLRSPSPEAPEPVPVRACTDAAPTGDAAPDGSAPHRRQAAARTRRTSPRGNGAHPRSAARAADREVGAFMAFLCHAAMIAMPHLALVGVAVGSGQPTATLRFTAPRDGSRLSRRPPHDRAERRVTCPRGHADLLPRRARRLRRSEPGARPVVPDQLNSVTQLGEDFSPPSWPRQGWRRYGGACAVRRSGAAGRACGRALGS